MDESFDLSIPEPCDYCLKDHALLKCTKCKVVYYHDQICQKKHWSTHKLQCNQFSDSLKHHQEMLNEIYRYENRNKEYVGKECSICYDIVETMPM